MEATMAARLLVLSRLQTRTGRKRAKVRVIKTRAKVKMVAREVVIINGVITEIKDRPVRAMCFSELTSGVEKYGVRVTITTHSHGTLPDSNSNLSNFNNKCNKVSR